VRFHSIRLGFALLLALLALLSVAGCDSLRVADAWVHPTPADAPGTAVYARIENPGATADRLLAVESAAGAAELRELTPRDGATQAAPVPGGLAVPAHGTLSLQPGGSVVVRLHAGQPIRPGQAISITFVFEHAGRRTVSAPALETAPQAGQSAASGDGPGEAGTDGKRRNGPRIQVQIGTGFGVQSTR